MLADDVDLEAIGRNEKCSYFTGADLAALVREAGILCLQEFISSNEVNKQLAIQSKHFDEAMMKTRPSVSAEVFNYTRLYYIILYSRISIIHPQTNHLATLNTHLIISICKS